MSGDLYYAPTGKTPVLQVGTAETVCVACFDVKKEEADLEEGHKGIGACMYDDADNIWYKDANFIGTIKATGSSGFMF